MARAKNKEELLASAKGNFDRLISFVEDFSHEDQEKEFPPGTLNRSIRDVLAHLHHWHTITLEWYRVGMDGNKPIMPAEGYTWKTTPALNKWIFDHYQNTSLEEAKNLLRSSFLQVQNIIESHSNEELFVKKWYKWTGSTSLGSYLVSCTASHYAWAYRLIKKVKK